MPKEEIYFNSKSKENWKLSNFYGGVEANYMKDRFLDKEVKQLFHIFETSDKETFIEYLKILQPNKKDWTEAKLKYWMKNDEPIRGILSQLVGTAVKDTAAGKKRLKIIKQLAGIEGDLKIKSNTTDKEKQDFMLTLLRKKYSKKEFADALLSTGDAILHEKPMRGRPNNWTYKNGEGGDWLGKLLMQVREELKSKKQKKNKN